MQEMDKNPESWEKIINHVAELEKNKDEVNGKLTSEILADGRKREKRYIAIIVLLVVVFSAIFIYWMYIFNSYEYVSQDGSGINSINTGNQENIGYESNGETEKERQE